MSTSAKKPQPNDKGGIIALVILAFVFSTFGIFGRFLDSNFSVFQQTYLRIFVAILITFIIFNKDLRFRSFLKLPKKEWLVLLFRSLLIYGFASLIYIQAMLTTTYSNATFLTAIPTIAVLGMIFLQERITLQKFGIIFLAFAGVLLISVQQFSGAFTFGRGELYALIADVFFSLAFIARKWHGNYLNNKEITFLILVISLFITLILSFIFDRSLPLTGWTPVYVIVIVLAAFFTVSSQLLMNYGFQHVKPFLANNILALEAVYALLIGLFLYTEIPTLQELTGGLLILLSVPLMNKLEEREKNKLPAAGGLSKS